MHAQATCPANDGSPYQFLRDDGNGTNNTTHAHNKFMQLNCIAFDVIRFMSKNYGFICARAKVTGTNEFYERRNSNNFFSFVGSMKLYDPHLANA